MRSETKYNGCSVRVDDRAINTLDVSFYGTTDTTFEVQRMNTSTWLSIRAENSYGETLDFALFGETAVKQFVSIANDRIDRIRSIADRMQDMAFQQRGIAEDAGEMDLAETFHTFVEAFEEIQALCDGSGDE